MATASVFDRAKAQMVLQDPFYACIMLNLEVITGEKLPDGRDLWMAATNGTQLFINPKNFETLTIGEAKGVLKHEVMHVAQLHPWRGEGKEGRRWNHATDMAINPIILEEGGELPKGVLDGTSFKGQSAEKIYEQLPPMPPGQGGGGKGPNGQPNNPLDDDVMPAADKSSVAQEKAKMMVAQAAAVAQAQGKLPAKVKAMLDDVLNPKVDWTEALRTWLTETTNDDYSMARPNRRFLTGDNPIYLPSMQGIGAMGILGFMFDTSGSMSMDMMKQALGEAAGAVADVKPSSLILAYCDAAVQHHEVFDQPTDAQVREKLERHGGGGTNMPAGLKWFTRKFPEVKAVIVFTDGETPWGSEEDYPFPVLWAITNPRITAPWGTTIHVPVD